MMKQIIFVVVAMLAVAQAAPVVQFALQTETAKKAMFHDFVMRFNKSYETAQEYEIRYNNFKDAMETIDALNAADEHATFGITKFADMSRAEFRSIYLMPEPVDHSKLPEAPLPTDMPLSDISAPESVDWRTKVGQYMTPVRNQGQCGSCWAFSVAENVASVSAIAGNTLVETSPQQIVDCDTQSDGCGGGYPTNAYQYIISAGGLETEQSYPYTAANGQCHAQPSLETVKISSWKYITQGGSGAVSAMKAGVVNQPLSICVDASSWQYYTGGVLSSNCGQQVDHCVMLAGYNSQNGQDYWIVRNSWGTDWGISGYIYVASGQNLCAIQTLVTTAVA